MLEAERTLLDDLGKPTKSSSQVKKPTKILVKITTKVGAGAGDYFCLPT